MDLVKRLERLLSLRARKEEAAARDVASQQKQLDNAEQRMRELVERRTKPMVDARRMAAFQMTGAWTADQLEAAHEAMIASSGDLERARADLHKLRTERKVLQEHVDRAREAAALIAGRVGQSAADELAVTRRLYLERRKRADS